MVQVPLGPRETVGVVWSLRDGAVSNLRRVNRPIDVEPREPGAPPPVNGSPATPWRRRARPSPCALRLPEESRTETAKVGVRATGMPPSRMTPGPGKVWRLAADKAVRGKRRWRSRPGSASA